MADKIDYTEYPLSKMVSRCPKCKRKGIRRKSKKMETFTHKTEIVVMMGMKVSKPYDMCII